MDGRAAWHEFPLRVSAAEIACAGVILVYALGIHNFDAMIDTLAMEAAAAPAAMRAAAEFRAAKARCAALPDGPRDPCRWAGGMNRTVRIGDAHRTFPAK